MPELARFIEAAKAKGAADAFLVELLKERGWPEKDIYEAFASHYEALTGVDVPSHGSGAEAAKDAFFYLLSFATLATWTIALASAWYTFIEIWFPDRVVNSGYSYGSSYNISSQMA